MFFSVFAVALLAEGVDRNDFDTLVEELDATSPSLRRAWIEIDYYAAHGSDVVVALLAEGVDRNGSFWYFRAVFLRVALLAEGVDRNTATLAANPYVLASPSLRRAWIEIRLF